MLPKGKFVVRQLDLTQEQILCVGGCDNNDSLLRSKADEATQKAR